MFSVEQRQGQREYQEDRADVRRLKAPYGHYLIATICDGHGGNQCVDFVINDFPRRVANALHDKLQTTKRPRVKTLLSNAVTQVVTAWDDKSLGVGVRQTIVDNATRAAHFAKVDMVAHERDGLDSGTTLVCAVVDEQRRKMWFVNLGDSRAVCKIDGQPLFSTIDHSVPDRRTGGGGEFQFEYKDGRVANDLAMTHAIGDNSANLVGAVKRESSTYTLSVPKGSNLTMIMASDGLFDIVNSQQITLNDRSHARELIDIDCAGQELHDNTTCLLYKLMKDLKISENLPPETAASINVVL
jgi:serine/threonine protein phosphatase PrpC